MTKKFNSFYLTLLVMLTGALVLAPAVTGLAATDTVTLYDSAQGTEISYVTSTSTPVYIKATDGTTNGGTRSATVSSPSSSSDIHVTLYDNGSSVDDTGNDGDYWGSFTVTDATTDDAVDEIEVSEGEAATATADLDGASDSGSASVTLDSTAPTMDSAETTTFDSVKVTFSEDLDDTTVETGDFTVGGSSPTSYTLSGNVVTLTMSGNFANTGVTPTVALTNSSSGIADLASNTNTSTNSVVAADGLKPRVDSLNWVESSTLRDPDTLELVFTEPIAIFGSASDYSATYGGSRDVKIKGVSNPNASGYNTVELEIDDQSTKTPATGAAFAAQVSNLSNVKDNAGNTVNASYASDTSGTVDDFVTNYTGGSNSQTPDFYSVKTVDLTTLEVVFSEDLVDTTAVANNFTVNSGADVTNVTPQSNVKYTMDLGSKLSAGTSATPQVKVVNNALEDIASNTLATGKTSNAATDGIAPVYDSANAVAVNQVNVVFSEGVAHADKGDFTVSYDGTDYTVSGTNISSATVELSLSSDLPTDAAPTVDYTQGTLSDTVSDDNLVASFSDKTAADKISPKLKTVDWNDVDDSGGITAQDTLVFSFSEAIDPSTVSASTLDSDLPPTAHSYGTGPSLAWSDGDIVLTVTLPSDVTLASSNDVDTATASSNSNVKDASTAGNVIADTGNVVIQDLEAPVLVEETGLHFETIQAAIDDTNTLGGHTIVVEDGIYEENLLIDKDLTIKSVNGPTSTTIDASGESGAAVTIAANGVTLGGEEVGFEIVAPDGHSDLTTSEDKNFGVVVMNYDDVTVIGNEIGGDTESPQMGIRVDNTGGAINDLQILDNTISTTYTPEQNAHVTTAGIRIRDGSNTVGEDDGDTLIAGNDISGFSVGAKLMALGGASNDPVVVELNNITGNDYNGLSVGVLTGGWLEVSENELLNNGGNGLAIGTASASDPAVDVLQNDIWGNGNGIEIYNAVGTVTDITINNNVIKNNTNTTVADDPNLTLTSGYENYGIYNNSGDTGTNIDAEDNYWGAVSGPAAVAGTSYDNPGPAPGGNGDKITDYVAYDPWLDADDNSVSGATVKVYLDAGGWNMISVNSYPASPTPSDLFGSTNASNLFHWDGSSYSSGDDIGNVSPKDGYWIYASSGDVPTPTGGGLTENLNEDGSAYEYGTPSDVTIPLNEPNTWYMISAPFRVDWGKAKVKGDGDWMLIENAVSSEVELLSGFLYTWEGGEYVQDLAPEGTIVAGRGYWVKTEGDVPTDGLTLKLPFSKPDQPTETDAAAVQAATAGFEPVPEGAEAPPAPPAAQGVSGELKASAVATADGVTFEVLGADVEAINVQVFNTNGAEIFSESASGNSLSWNTDVANGVYLYGVSAEVNGETKPLGIKKLLILE